MNNIKKIKGSLISALFVIVSCSNSEKLEVIIPEEIKVPKDSFNTTYLILKNTSFNELIVKNVKTSCQCLIIDKINFTIKPYSNDTIQIRFYGNNDLGKNSENLIFTFENDYKSININYEIIN